VRVEEMERIVGYQVAQLALAARHRLGPDTRLWLQRAQTIDGRQESFVPADLLRLDATVVPVWDPPLFQATSNGLASGNTLAEALLHGMYEVVERDTLTGTRPDSSLRRIAPQTVHGAALEWLLGCLRSARVEVEIAAGLNPFGIPTFTAAIWSEAFPRTFKGNGTHLDSAVALSRALTEAAQSRATVIAGARDDIGKLVYLEGKAFGIRRSAGRTFTGISDLPPISFDAIASQRLPDTEAEVELVARMIQAVTGHQPLYVDLTQPEIAVPVAHVVCPGTLFDANH
jgi:ribosomal protein S12 methylthiotransferase accessory factor